MYYIIHHTEFFSTCTSKTCLHHSSSQFFHHFRSRPVEQSPEALGCDYCNRKGHMTRDCTELKANQSFSLHYSKPCSYCLELGHDVSNCEFKWTMTQRLALHRERLEDEARRYLNKYFMSYLFISLITLLFVMNNFFCFRRCTYLSTFVL